MRTRISGYLGAGLVWLGVAVGGGALVGCHRSNGANETWNGLAGSVRFAGDREKGSPQVVERTYRYKGEKMSSTGEPPTMGPTQATGIGGSGQVISYGGRHVKGAGPHSGHHNLNQKKKKK